MRRCEHEKTLRAGDSRPAAGGRRKRVNGKLPTAAARALERADGGPGVRPSTTQTVPARLGPENVVQ